MFLVPAFVVDYFIQRAADFLDWRSGLFRFPRAPGEIAQAVERFVGTDGYTEYLAWPPEQRRERILQLKQLQAICPDPESQAKLLLELGLLFAAEQNYENAVASFDQAIEVKPDYHKAWFNRGNALSALGRNEEAIASYDKAIELKPDDDAAWYNKACCYGLQNQIEVAITSLQQAISLDAKYQEMAKTDSDFDLIRDDPRFQALLVSGQQE